MPIIPDRLKYVVGEKPPALPCGYYDKDDVLDDSIASATLTAMTWINSASSPTNITCTNNDDGTFTIDWSTVTSDFTEAGTMKVRINVDDGTRSWYMDAFSLEIEAL